MKGKQVGLSLKDDVAKKANPNYRVGCPYLVMWESSKGMRHGN